MRGFAQRSPLPVGLGARTLGFRRGTDGVTPKQEPHRRFIETRDVQDRRRRLLRVAGLRAIVLALKPRGGSDRRGIGGVFPRERFWRIPESPAGSPRPR